MFEVVSTQTLVKKYNNKKNTNRKPYLRERKKIRVETAKNETLIKNWNNIDTWKTYSKNEEEASLPDKTELKQKIKRKKRINFKTLKKIRTWNGERKINENRGLATLLEGASYLFQSKFKANLF